MSIPTRLLEAVDRDLVQDHESRSSVVRSLLEAALRQAEERAAVEQYVRGYREQPDTEEEFGWQDEIALEYFAAHPWP